jgi:hypothetical protein
MEASQKSNRYREQLHLAALSESMQPKQQSMKKVGMQQCLFVN